MASFLLNDELITLTDIDPNTSVLQFLRQRQRTGTKEGCASGDCGACTVVTAELDPQNQLIYKNINACITFVSALHGKQLLSVEDLQSEQKLHCVQQAMVDKDGSQCGFCTPGFVMSLFALKKQRDSYDRHSVQQALAGNLCRCTGYRAIDSAAQQTLNSPQLDCFSPLEAQTSLQLQQILQSSPACPVLESNGNICHLPTDIETLAQLLTDHPQSTLVAGGTDLAIAVTQHGKTFSRMISLSGVTQLRKVTSTAQQLEIGAAVPLHECQGAFKVKFPDFSLLLERFASLQIRYQGTLGGNIANASPIGDAPPALIALDAQLLLRRGSAQRTVSVEAFFVDYKKTLLQPSEFIEKIIIPIPAHKFHFKIYKISKRLDDDISAICTANYLCLDQDNKVVDIRLAYGGMAAIAKRATKTEQALLGAHWSAANIDNALGYLSSDFQPLSDFRASSQYRMSCAENLLKKFFYETQMQQSSADSSLKTRIFDYV